MCTGKCSRFVALALYPLAVLSIALNIGLFFPDGDTQYTRDDHITEEVKYMGGLIGGGAMVLLPALYIHLTGTQSCCANRCGMFLSIGFAGVGVIGGLYSLTVASLALQNGPLCQMLSLVWITPFKDTKGEYLSDSSSWKLCTAPANVVEFHIGMFATLLALSCLEIILCAIQMVNGLVGCLCGTCAKKTVV
uniref:Transmembrane 4 L six family member 21a n=2 Tax=Tetraodon nigroviridis TaxID=99883 RepID=H3D2H9_TETNG